MVANSVADIQMLWVMKTTLVVSSCVLW